MSESQSPSVLVPVPCRCAWSGKCVATGSGSGSGSDSDKDSGKWQWQFRLRPREASKWMMVLRQLRGLVDRTRQEGLKLKVPPVWDQTATLPKIRAADCPRLAVGRAGGGGGGVRRQVR